MQGVETMYQERIELTIKDILEKDFKIDTRGYRPQEVDKFLDLIMHDYNEFITIIKELNREKKDLVEDNIALKQEVRNLKQKFEILRETPSIDTTNSDLLRRISNLEKIIYGKE